MEKKLKFLIKNLILISLSMNFFLFLPNAIAKPNDIVGKWQTIDDKTQQPRSIIQIWRVGNNYKGKVIASLRKNQRKNGDICLECKGRYHNKTVLGETIIWGLHKKRYNRWDDGRILDPTSDKVYRVSMSLAEQGSKLRVHGYIGIPLLGRTQVWNRVVS